jgi:hypothetical protein
MRLLIIQTSPPHTCSTFLINSIYGLIPELHDKKIIGTWNRNFQNKFENIIAVKCHDINIDELIKKYNNYKLVFICSERKEYNNLIDKKYKDYDNVVVFEYNELNETNDNPLSKIVDNIYEKVKKVIPENIELNKEKCINRINLMNKRYEEIKDKDFKYIDPFFEIHGSHRNRINKNVV